MSKSDGGPAFPTATETDEYGMTLRDYFAGQALAGCLTSLVPEGLTWEDITISAYEMADAMLKERDK